MIKKLTIKQFGGISNRTVNFSEGLNVLFGPNEAGKSTVVEALYAMLWVDAKLGLKRVEDKTFADRAFPYGVSPFAECELEFEMEGVTCTLYKLWHQQTPKVELVVGDQKIIVQNEIDAFMKKYLSAGAGTYQHVIFSKQDVFKKVFEHIKADEETYHTTAQLLKEATMELGGLPLERFRGKLEEQLEALCGNWDLDKNAPSKNKNWQDPHKKNIGRILELHYEYEKYQYEYQKAESTEKVLEGYQAELKILVARKEHLEQQLSEISGLELDVMKRTELESSKRDIEQKMKSLFEINKRWPMLEVEMSSTTASCDALEMESKAIQERMATQKRYEVYQKTQALLEKRKRLEEEMGQLNVKIESLKGFDREGIATLTKLEQVIRESKLKLDSSKIGGHILKASEPVRISDAFGERVALDDTGKWQSEAYMKIEIKDVVTLEIQSLDFDFDGIKQVYDEGVKAFDAQLNALQVQSVEQAKLQNERLASLMNDRKILDRDLKELPLLEVLTVSEEDGVTFASYTPVDLAQLSQNTMQLENQIRDLKIKQNAQNYELAQYQKQFENHDAVAMAMVNMMVEKKELDIKLSELSQLPEAFDTIDDYLKQMKQLRDDRDQCMRKIGEVEIEIVRALSDLPERTSIESLELFSAADQLKNAQIKKAKQLERILNKLTEVVARFENGTSSRLEAEFNHYMSLMTEHAYAKAQIDQQLDIKVKSLKAELPLRLLSSGTLDSVVLSFRLAMIRSLPVSRPLMTVLDDSLVNMDKSRRAQAVNVITSHAQTHQVIFVTCHEDVAQQLGGRRIDL